MALSSDLISQFVKQTNDKPVEKKESKVYATVVKSDGRTYAKFDGSDLLTPIDSTVDAKDGERVEVTIKNHTATINGNLSSPAARTDDVQEIGKKVAEFDVIIADKVSTEVLEAEKARIDSLVAENATIKGTLTATTGKIETLESDNVTIKETLTANAADITNLRAEIAEFDFAEVKDLEAANARINNLEATYVSATELEAERAEIDELLTTKLTAESADIRYAQIDFSNIKMAAVEELFTKSGIIKNLVVGDTSITGELVGVTIKGDLIEGNTIKADKLVVKGEDGLYYKLNVDSLGETTASSDTKYQNGLDGSVIIAKSITATKVDVKDLVAFDATIGGFKITENSLYSGAKASVGNTTRGIYLDDDGQMAIGDSSNYIKYYKDTDGSYKLAVAAKSIVFGASAKNVEDALTEVNDSINNLEIGGTQILRGTNTATTLVTTSGSGMWETGSWRAARTTTGDGIYRESIVVKDAPNANIKLGWKLYGANGTLDIAQDHVPIVSGNTYTLSCYARGNGTLRLDYGYSVFDAKTYAVSNATTWTKYSRTFVPNETAGTVQDGRANIYFGRANESGASIEICGMKLEKGNKATDWTPAPEDTTAEINDTINNLEIGGRNLLYKSKFDQKYDSAWTYDAMVTYVFEDGYATLTKETATGLRKFTSQISTSNPNLVPEEGCAYTMSAEVMKIPTFDIGALTEVFMRYTYTDGSYIDKKIAIPSDISEEKWTMLSFSWTYSSLKTIDNVQCIVALEQGICGIKIRNLKLEKGSKATDWTPAPEDILTDINDAVNSIEVGGRNYIINSDQDVTLVGEGLETAVTNAQIYCSSLDIAESLDGKEMTISFDLENAVTEGFCRLATSVSYKKICDFSAELNTENKRYSFTITITDVDHEKTSLFYLQGKFVGSVTLRNIKLEMGNKATDWTPAPEDVDDDIQTAQNSGDKAQADLEEANNRLNEAELRIDAIEGQIVLTTTDEDGTTSLIQNGSGWTFNLDGLATQVSDTSEAVGTLEDDLAIESEKVKTMSETVDELSDLPGHIYVGTTDDGDPCIEICQDSTQTKVQITDDAINFVAGSSIPAYIVNDETEGSKLKIEHAEVTDELAFGGFSWKVRSNGNMGLIWKG